jgi:hypothetical protein
MPCPASCIQSASPRTQRAAAMELRMDERDKPLAKKSSRAEIDGFVRRLSMTPAGGRAGRRGRLIFAMDATASRQAAWDRASHIQAEMFRETTRLGGLEIQLCHFGGFREFSASAWTDDAASLLGLMTAVRCQAGHTQIETVLRHAIDEAGKRAVDALVYVGDSVEEEIDRLAHQAGRLALLGLPAFVFHEGSDPVAARALREIARLSRGAYCAFDANSPQQLRDLLGAIAVYAAGGRKALADYGRDQRDAVVRQLTHQLDGK